MIVHVLSKNGIDRPGKIWYTKEKIKGELL